MLMLMLILMLMGGVLVGMGLIRVLCVIVVGLRKVIRLGKLNSRYFRILIRGYS